MLTNGFHRDGWVLRVIVRGNFAFSILGNNVILPQGDIFHNALNGWVFAIFGLCPGHQIRTDAPSLFLRHFDLFVGHDDTLKIIASLIGPLSSLIDMEGNNGPADR